MVVAYQKGVAAIRDQLVKGIPNFTHCPPCYSNAQLTTSVGRQLECSCDASDGYLSNQRASFPRYHLNGSTNPPKTSCGYHRFRVRIFFEKSFCSAYMVFIRVGGLALAIKLKQQLGYDNFTVRPYLDPRISCYYSCVSVCRFSRKRKTLAEHGECVIASLCWHSGLRNWCLYIWLLQDNIYPVSRVPL